MKASLSYRPDIDGLRAIAVLSVVFFHLGNTPFTGGYAGVDIFFVISGYLITSLIVKDLQFGQFSLARFYERRILRILPALFFMMSVTAILGAFILFPPDFEYFGQSLVASAASISNILFWQKSGYFEANAMTVPLLHTWSLCVEEQFYIVFPLVLILVYKYARRFLIPILVTGFILSFVLACIAAKMGMTALLFYLLPSRAWELLLGALLAVNISPSVKSKLAVNGLSFTGLTMISYAMFAFNEDALFPGPAALVPTLGAGLLIYAGQARSGFIYQCLGSKLPVFIGRMSYSFYLWHWPFIVFAHYALPVDMTLNVSSVLLAVIFAVSFLSYKFVETPLRHQAKFSRSKVFITAASISILFIAGGLIISKAKGFPDRFPKDIQSLYKVTVGGDLPSVEGAFPNSFNHVLGDPNAKADFLVWGDSHTRAAAPGLDLAAKSLKLKGYMLGQHSCLPSITDAPTAIGPCNAFNKSVMNFLKAHQEIKTIILIGHWSIHEIRYAKETRSGKLESDYFYKTLDGVIDYLQRDGRKVVLMVEMPHAPVMNVPLYVARARYYNLSLPESFDLTTAHKREEGVREAFGRLKAKYNLPIIEPSDYLCPEGKCPFIIQSYPLYEDDNHITASAAQNLHKMYLPLLRQK